MNRFLIIQKEPKHVKHGKDPLESAKIIALQITGPHARIIIKKRSAGEHKENIYAGIFSPDAVCMRIKKWKIRILRRRIADAGKVINHNNKSGNAPYKVKAVNTFFFCHAVCASCWDFKHILPHMLKNARGFTDF